VKGMVCFETIFQKEVIFITEKIDYAKQEIFSCGYKTSS
jgi:hypothetical protein